MICSENWKSFSETEAYQFLGTGPSTPRSVEDAELMVKLDLTLTTDFGRCSLHLSEHSAFPLEVSVNTPPKQEKMPRMETFPFPPFCLQVQHVLTSTGEQKSNEKFPNPDPGGDSDGKSNRSETTLTLVLESSHIKFSPYLIVFMNEILASIDFTPRNQLEGSSTFEKLQPYCKCTS